MPVVGALRVPSMEACGYAVWPHVLCPWGSCCWLAVCAFSHLSKVSVTPSTPKAPLAKCPESFRSLPRFQQAGLLGRGLITQPRLVNSRAGEGAWWVLHCWAAALGPSPSY